MSRSVKLQEKEGGVGWQWLQTTFKMGRSVQEAPLLLPPGKTTQKMLERNIWTTDKRGRLLTASTGPN